ncbi:hypothetical protein HJC23_006537 [Cyclotella cryptica]|uniref:Uncharacterized protein n=1 Tax=Cyclotella cryptica TaxID=29204 RepID=A0ABD3PK99_9STRA
MIDYQFNKNLTPLIFGHYCFACHQRIVCLSLFPQSEKNEKAESSVFSFPRESLPLLFTETLLPPSGGNIASFGSSGRVDLDGLVDEPRILGRVFLLLEIGDVMLPPRLSSSCAKYGKVLLPSGSELFF